MKVMAPDPKRVPPPLPAPPLPASLAAPKPPRGGGPVTLGAHSGYRISTPLLLRVGMAVVLLPILLLAAVIQVSVSRNDRAVDTVGQGATRGITAAQEIKRELAELDEIAVASLIDEIPLQASGFPEVYNNKRSELSDTLVLAAAESPTGDAHQQPLTTIDYALAHYHALIQDTYASTAAGNPEQTITLYDQAHAVMRDTLLPEADFLDKANTYVLNNTYEDHRAGVDDTEAYIYLSALLLVLFLAGLQLLVFRRFRRILSVALLAALIVTATTASFAVARLEESSESLAAAREESFDAVHALARAEATVVEARAIEGHQVLSPGAGRDSSLFLDAVDRVASDEDGYLGDVIDADVSSEVNTLATNAGEALQDYRSGHNRVANENYSDTTSYDSLLGALDETQAFAQAVFDERARHAADAPDPVPVVNIIAALAVALLVLIGLYPRLREYGGGR